MNDVVGSSSRALGLLLLTEFVPVARALILVSVSARRNTLALLAAYPTIFDAPVLDPCFGAPVIALGYTKT